jgi:hypothetical protein
MQMTLTSVSVLTKSREELKLKLNITLKEIEKCCFTNRLVLIRYSITSEEIITNVST